MKYIYVIAAIIVVFGCKEKDDVPDYASQVAGKYKGIFQYKIQGNSTLYSDTNVTYTITRINNSTINISLGGHDYSSNATINSSFDFTGSPKGEGYYDQKTNAVFWWSFFTNEETSAYSLTNFSGTKQ